LKDYLQDARKELKIDPSNDEGFEQMVLQSDKFLAQLKATDGHATIQQPSTPSFIPSSSCGPSSIAHTLNGKSQLKVDLLAS
jgi:hypothetical protein